MYDSYEGSEARPWVRYWARSVDFLAYNAIPFLLMMGSLFSMASAIKPGAGPYCGMAFFAMGGVIVLLACLLFVLICFLGGWIVLESFCFAMFGTTPGKALLRISVRNADGSTLSFGQAFMRGLKIWFRCYGLFIPLISLVTMCMTYSRLQDKQITSWDEDASIVVTHSKIGPLRIAITVGIFVFYQALCSLLQLMNLSHHYPYHR